MKREVLTLLSFTNTLPGSQNSLGRCRIIELLIHRACRADPCKYACFQKEWKVPCNTCPQETLIIICFLSYFLMKETLFFFFPQNKRRPIPNSQPKYSTINICLFAVFCLRSFKCCFHCDLISVFYNLGIVISPFFNLPSLGKSDKFQSLENMIIFMTM